MLKRVFLTLQCLQTFWSGIWLPYVHNLSLKWWADSWSPGISSFLAAFTLIIKLCGFQNELFSLLAYLGMHLIFKYMLFGYWIKARINWSSVLGRAAKFIILSCACFWVWCLCSLNTFQLRMIDGCDWTWMCTYELTVHFSSAALYCLCLQRQGLLLSLQLSFD